MKVHQNVEFSHFQKATVAMLNFFDNHKDTLSFRNSVSCASSPYEVADKVWRVLCSEEVSYNWIYTQKNYAYSFLEGRN